VHQVRRAFGPGLLGVAWSYADDADPRNLNADA